jgi:hypothetical protein
MGDDYQKVPKRSYFGQGAGAASGTAFIGVLPENA